ncbi:hypothetical protein N7481_008727 [Penicillium waksmanii]|uniref:uncharacterized protein n=1 Tax=Penicillium waksmanii TaxID=69791 RepID=UPI002546C2A6|nr:uncharacterized protein N7481_008727 [Penicillium waksmanii]KAJ5975020.1 hypothetical protein N7481_008727 [Penicillium waksmanii]
MSNQVNEEDQMEWHLDTDVMDWEDNIAVADWSILTNPSQDGQSEPPSHGLVPRRHSLSHSNAQHQQELGVLDMSFATGVMDWEVENEVANWRMLTNASPDRRSQSNHYSPSFTRNQSDDVSQGGLYDGAIDMGFDDTFVGAEDTAVGDARVDDTAVDTDNTLVAMDVDDTFADLEDKFPDLDDTLTRMDVDDTLAVASVDLVANDTAIMEFDFSKTLLDLEAGDRVLDWGTKNQPQVPESQPETSIFPKGQEFLQICTMLGCAERMVDGRHCEYHKAQEIPTTCIDFGCTSRSMVEGYCFDHWTQAHGCEPDNEQFDCNFPGCINKKESGSLLCTWHADGENPDDSHFRRRKCESTGCIAQKRKGLYCVSHWNELNPHDMICAFSGCANPRRKHESYCGRHMKQKDLVRNGPKYSTRDACTFPGCPNRRKKQRLCESHWNLENPGQKCRTKAKKVCTTSGCEKNAWRKSLCYHHAAEMWPGSIICEVSECGNNKWKGGLCEKHFGGSRSRVKVSSKVCTSTGCDKSSWRKSLCYQHAKEMWPESILCEFPGCTQRRRKDGLCEKHLDGEEPRFQ